MEIHSLWPILGFLTLYFCAIGCAWGTRVAIGSRFELAFQFLFLLAMTIVGIATWLSRSEQIGLIVPSGMTLAAMVLLAIGDFRRPHELAHRESPAMHR
jgi:hypothetical protein